MAREKRVRPSRDAVDDLVDQFENAVLTGDQRQAERLTRALWDNRNLLPEILAERLIASRSKIPVLEFEMLEGFAGENTPDYLSRIAGSTECPDIVRFGARRRLGWTPRGEARARVDFLATLDDDVDTLVTALEQAIRGQSFPPNGEVLAEVVGYLLAMPAPRAVKVVDAAVQQLGLDVAWPLRALLHARSQDLRAAALKQIAALGDRGAVPALERAARFARGARWRSELQAVERRLQFKPVDGRAEEAESRLMPPVHSAYLSEIDGDGGQIAILLREWGEGVYTLVQVFFNEGWGVKDAWGINHVQWQRLETLYETGGTRRLVAFGGTEEESGIELVEVEPAALRGALNLALEANAATSHPVPPVFELWEPLLHDQDPPAEDEQVVVPTLDDTEYADRLDLQRNARRLFEHPFFDHWFFNPEEIEAAMEGVESPAGLKLTDRQYHPLIARLVGEPARQRIRARLRRQAWLLDRNGDARARDLALAAAARLPSGGEAALGREPFLREMVRLSLQNALGFYFEG